MSAPALSPTTGETVDVVARRNRLGVILLIVADFSGMMALIISYCYLWSLNVNNGWAPNEQTFGGNDSLSSRAPLPWAADWPFWAILGLTVVSTLLLWWGSRGNYSGHRGRLVLGSALASLVMLAAFVMQIWQMATFPFGPSNGAYASAVFLLTGSAAVHLGLLGFLLVAITNRTRAGLISPDNPSQARLVNFYMTWICASLLLACLCTTFLKASSNVDPPEFGTFNKFAPAASASPSPSPSP